MSNCSTRRPKLTTEEFIARSRIKHGWKYDYSDTIYINARSEVSIKCATHGKFNQRAGGHLSGAGCPKCKKNYPMDTASFKERARLKHGDLYDYSKSICVGAEKNITITCKRHGDFNQIAKIHVQGSKCPKCRKHVFDNKSFIEKSKSIYGEKYTYLDDSFISEDIKVKVVCRKHGVFEQKMDNHFRYDGCKKCKTQRKRLSAAMACRDDRSSYKRSGYIKICKNNNGMSNLYVIKMLGDNEIFYKVGITKTSIKERFRSNPYQIEEVAFITSDAGFVFDLEKQLHRILSKYQYRPLLKFDGSTLECFSEIPKSVIKLIDSINKTPQLHLLV